MHIDELIIQRLVYKLKNEPPLESWFDEVKLAVIYKIEVITCVLRIHVLNVVSHKIFPLPIERRQIYAIISQEYGIYSHVSRT